MSLIPVTLNNAVDTYVYKTRPSTNYPNNAVIRLSASSTATQYGYIYFPRPFPLGATITNSVLHLRQVGTFTGTRSVTVRLVLATFKMSQLVWNNQPAIDTVVAGTVSKTASVDGTSWDLDITAAMQRVSDGLAWWGLRIETSDTNSISFHSADSTILKPTLDCSWTDAPQAPTTLSPAGGRAVGVTKPVLRFDFTDHVGNTALQAVQVQANATNAWTAPTFDSYPVTTSTPQLDLSGSFVKVVSATRTSASTTVTTTATPPIFAQSDVGSVASGTGIPTGATIVSVASNGLSAVLSSAATASGTSNLTLTEVFPAMTTGQVMYWRVSVQDGAGVWSPWSLAASFTYQAHPALTITNPAVSPNNFVTESTPPITWTFTGQTAYQVMLLNTAGAVVFSSGKITGTTNTYTLPAKLLKDATTYTIVVRCWDNAISREATPNDPAYVEASRLFTYNLSSSVAGVTSLTGTDLSPVPGLQLDWVRSTAPDSFVVVCDGVVVASNLLPGDVLVSGTAYRYVDSTQDPRTPHTWTVRAVVNGVTSSSNPTVTKTLQPVGVWITDPASGTAVQLMGSDAVTWTNGEDAEIYTPVGGTRIVRVTQSLRGAEGQVTGQLLTLPTPGATPVATSTANMYYLKGLVGAVLNLTLSDQAFPVVIGNVTIAPIRGNEVRKQVTFDYWQVDDLPFQATL